MAIFYGIFKTKNNTIFFILDNLCPPPSSSEQAKVKQRRGSDKEELYCLSSVAGFPLPRDLRSYVTLLFWFIVNQKSIIELRNTLSKTDLHGIAPGILKFSDLLNWNFWVISIKKQGLIWPWLWEIGLMLSLLPFFHALICNTF